MMVITVKGIYISEMFKCEKRNMRLRLHEIG